MNVRERLIEALKFDERIWRAYEVLKPIHREGLLDALQRALTADNEEATLLDNMQERLEQWFRRVVTQARCEGEAASITFELRGEPVSGTDGEVYEATVEEKLYADHLSGTIKR